jgi:mono/diheme cytochrome c family protein
MREHLQPKKNKLTPNLNLKPNSMFKKIKKVFKWTGIILLLLIAGLSITVALRQNLKFDAPYPAITASKDSAVLARGKHLVYGPAHCADCHSPAGTDSLVNIGQLVELSGGKQFNLPIGTIYPPNITSDAETGIGKFTDGELARAFRFGVGHTGNALFDFMPFHNACDDDLTAVISYLRTVRPVKKPTPPSSTNLLGKVIKAFVIKPVGPDGEPGKSVKEDSTAEYGKYLAMYVANCRGCHTDRDLKTGAYAGPFYAGGFAIESLVDDKYIFHTPNISPDKKTGHIYSWSEADFLQRFRKGKVYPQSPMPWGPFGQMSDLEIKAIYRFLQTVTPVDKKIDKVVEVKT